METFEQKLQRVIAEPIEVVEYDPAWPLVFAAEAARLRSFFPLGSILRIEHIGSTAVPGLPAKPIVDIIVGVRDVGFARDEVAPLMEAAGYDYFWRPTIGNEGPFYPWFIGSDEDGKRLSHMHVVEMGNADQWDRVLFRDYLRAHRQTADEYGALKRDLASRFPGDREAYTWHKTAFIVRVTGERKKPRPLKSSLGCDTKSHS